VDVKGNTAKEADMNKSILICGVGGQGTVLASRIIAASAMEAGENVMSAETIGMAQRGGPVTSHVRIGSEVFSPLIPFGQADMILAFEPAEAVRNLKYLKKGGIVVANTVPVKPVTESVNDTGYDGSSMTEYLKKNLKCVFADSDKAVDRFGSSKFFNIIMLGIACGIGELGIEKEELEEQIRKSVPEKYLDINLEAFNEGLMTGEKYKGDSNGDK
jgi:indolepyruvate ferredoxin oxidoreductase beta subunit